MLLNQKYFFEYHILEMGALNEDYSIQERSEILSDRFFFDFSIIVIPLFFQSFSFEQLGNFLM